MKKLNFWKASLFLLGIFTAFSCEIGLGAAVDTEAPVIEIASPVVDAVIRDSFRIAGTWSDDGTISSVSIILDKTDGKLSYGPYYADVVTSEDSTVPNTWSCVVNPLENEKILDGSYLATISISDEGGHTTIQTRQFTIDNTAPIIVLQRPSSKSVDLSPDSYGQTFTLEGQAADDNNINLIKVKIYSDPECTNLVHYVDLTNVPPTISLDVAKFIENDDTTDYSKIYGSSKKDGTKQLYCTIESYDGSQRYPADGSNQTPEDLKGNVTTTYYLYEEIASSVLAENRITEVYHMLNGNYLLSDSSRSADTVTKVADSLAKSKVEKGTFSLNPANNPTFMVSGREPLKMNGHDFDEGTQRDNVEITNGSRIQVEIATGLDASPLIKDTLGVYVVECDLAGNIIGSPITIVKQKAVRNGVDIVQTLTDSAEIENRESLISKSGTSYKIAVTLDAAINTQLKVGKNYLIFANGCDENKADIAAFGNYYGFYFASSGNPPKLELSTPANGISYNKKNSNIAVKGYSTTELSYPELTILVHDSNGSEIYRKQFTSEGIAGKKYEAEGVTTSNPDNKQRVDFDCAIPSSVFSQTSSGQYSLSVTASEGDKKSTLDRTLIYDVDGPSINIDSLLPTAEKYIAAKEDGSKESGEFLNGIITLKMSIVDEYDVVATAEPAQGEEDHRPYLEIQKDGKALEFISNNEQNKRTKLYITNPSKSTVTIDTTSLPDGQVTFVIYAWDRAGNAGEVLKKTYIIDQTTDYPVVLSNDPSKISLKVNTKTEIENGLGKNMIAQGGQLLLRLIDDDSIQSIAIYNTLLSTADDWNKAEPEWNLVKEEAKAGTELTYTINLPTTSGFYRYKLIVKDVNGKTTTVGPFAIYLTAAAPTIAGITVSPSYISKNTASKINDPSTYPDTLKNKLEILSDQAPFYVFRKVDYATPWNLETDKENNYATTGEGKNIQFIGKIDADGNKTEYFYEDEVSPDSTTKYYYVVRDRNFQESNTKEINCSVDNVTPTVKVSSMPTLADTKESVSVFTFQGTAHDEDENGNVGSGVSEVQLKITDAVNSTKTKTVTVTGTQNWVYALKYADWSEVFGVEGVKKVDIRVIDNAGNYTDYPQQEFIYDKAVPGLELSTENSIQVNKNFKVEGKVWDSYGLLSNTNVVITVKKDDAVIGSYPITLPDATSKPADNNLSWTIETGDGKYISESGKYKLTVTVKDKAGNTTSEDINVLYDVTAPTELTISSPDSSYVGANALSNANFTFAGTVKDNDGGTGVASFSYQFTKSATAPAATDANWVKVDSATENWSFQKALGNGAGQLAEGAGWYLWVKAADKAGNETKQANYANVKFDVDKEKPQLKDATLSAPAATEGNTSLYKADFTLSGKAWDSNAMAATDSVVITAKDASTGTVKKTWKKNISATAEPGAANFSVSIKTGIGNKNDTYYLADGKYVLTITATDVVGKTATWEKNITVDTEAPAVSVDTPADNELLTSMPVTITGSVSDSASGPATGDAAGDYVLTPVSGETQTGAAPISGKVKVNTNGTWSASVNDAAAKQGKYKLTVTLSDKAGHSTTTTARTIIYDSEKPALSGVSVKKGGVTVTATNGTVTVSGTASDTWGLRSTDPVEIKDSLNASSSWKPTVSSSDGSFSQEIELGTEPGKLTDGKHKLTVTAYDLSGQSTSETVEITVDTQAPEGTVTNVPTVIQTQGESFVFSGNVTEHGLSGAAKTEISFDGTHWVEADLIGTTKWQKNVTFSENTNYWGVFAETNQGSKTVYVRVTDNAGNYTGQSESGTTLGSKTFVYDIAKPQVELTTGSEIQVKGNFTISGKAWDSNGLAAGNNVTITVKNSSESVIGSYPTSAVSSQTKPGTDNISYTVETGSGKYISESGTYYISVKAKDVAGKDSDISTVKVVYDVTAPTVLTISSPDSSYTGINAIKNDNFTFAGTVKDNDGGTGVASFSYQFTKSGTAPAATDANWVKVDSATQNWSFQKALGNGAGQLAEGAGWYLWVKAADKAGNETAQANYAKVKFDVDKENPQLKDAGLSTPAAEEGNTALYKADFTVSGKAWDSNAMAATDSVVITAKDASTGTVKKEWKNNVTATAEPGAANFSVSIKTGIGNKNDTYYLADGKYVLTITATDVVGKTTIWSKNITVDTEAPTASITSHQNGDKVNSVNPLKIEGTSSDATSGIKDGTYSLKYNGSEIKSESLTIQANGNWVANIPQTEFQNNGKDVEGDYSYTVSVNDNAGYSFTTDAVTVTFDKEVPHVEITYPTTNVVTNKGFIVKGKAYDTYGITTDGIVVTLVDSTGTSTDIKKFSTAAKTLPENENWSMAFITANGAEIWAASTAYSAGTLVQSGSPVKYYECLKDVTAAGNIPLTNAIYWKETETYTLSAGKYTVQVTAQDKAGKLDNDVQKLSVHIDVSKPTITTAAVNDSAINAKNKNSVSYNENTAVVYNITQIPVQVVAADETGGSGLSNVFYTTNENPGVNDWSALGLSNNKYVGTVTCDWEGQKNITIRLEDKAGNINDYNIPVLIDTKAPSTAEADLSGSKLVNGQNAVTVKITAKDEETKGQGAYNSGIASVEVIKIGTTSISGVTSTSGTNGVYTLTIPSGKIYNGTVTVRVTDNAKNYIDISPFQFQLDNSAPYAAITLPDDADTVTNGVQVNKTITLRGTAGDDQGLKEDNPVELFYTKAANPGDEDWISLGYADGTTSWTKTINTASAFGTIADGTTVKIKAQVTDKAENSSAKSKNLTTGVLSDNTISIIVNQNTDRPQIYLTTITVPSDMTADNSMSEFTGTINGTVSDDDGIISQIKITPWKGTKAAGATEYTWTSKDSSNVTVTNGTWKYTFPKTETEFDDGLWKLVFEVTDKAETFNSSNASALNQPRLFGATTSGYSEFTGEKTDLYFTLDTHKPSYNGFKYSVDNGANWDSNYTSKTFGGDTKSFSVKINASDTNGIESVKATFGNQIDISGTSPSDPNGNGEWIITGLSSEKTNISTDGSNELKIVITDKTGNYSEFVAQLNVDNTAPEIKISAPDSTQYSSGNVTAYGTVDSVTKMYYALSLDNSTAPGADSENKGTAVTSWKKEDGTEGGTISYKPYYQSIKGTSLSWYIYFDDGETTEIATHEQSLKRFLVSSGVTTDAAIREKSFTDIVQLWLWIKAKDDAGNENFEKHLILVDPQGDAPKVTIDYPSKNGAVLGGTETLRGTAIDTIGKNIGVDSVWVQIISAINNGYTSSNQTQTHTTGGFKFTDTVSDTKHTITINDFKPTLKDVKQWIAEGYGVYKDITNATPTAVTTEPSGNDTDDGSAYYIKATFEGSAWSLKINSNSEFNPDSGYINPIAYRVYAKDKDNTLSKYQLQYGLFDSDNPVVSHIYLKQFSDNESGTGSVLASRMYEDDMWVKGVWWLCGEVSDTNGLSALRVGNNTIPVEGTENKVESFQVKLDTGAQDKAGKVTPVIEASDRVNEGATPHTTKIACSINFDNKEPVILSSGNIDTNIRNSNGFYGFGAKVTEDPVVDEAQSGFDYLAFWFERNITGKHVVYDVMRSKENSEITYEDLTPDSGLMWKEKTVTRSNTSLGTLTLSEADSNIHVGGLCKIGGTIYLITSVEGMTIGIKGQPEVTHTTAYFAMANVVNNTIEAGSGAKSTADGMYGYYTNMSNDDGDNMVESVNKAGTTWTWEAYINSQNIKDGSVVLHYVAFDKAGNYTVDQITANVSNNGPRLASLKVWSDFNENSTEDAGEYETYYYNSKERKINGSYVERATKVTDTLVVSGNNKDFKDGGSAFMTVKAATVFKPEIVGGNGDLYYSYKAGSAAVLETENKTIGSASIGTGSDHGIDEEIDSTGYYKADENEQGYVIGKEFTISDLTADKLNSLGNSTSAAAPTWFEYTIYDSTEGCDATWDTTTLSTTNRLSATFRVALNVQYQDSEKPKAWIRPFYWNKSGKSDSETVLNNSIEWDSTGKIPQGHIELEADLTNAIKTAMGNEPKVSGIVKVEGYAFDDIKLKTLSVKFADHTDLDTAKTASTYNGTWSSTAYDATKGWGFSANDVYCNGNGHLVHWVLTVDTAKGTNAAGLDKAIEITATDARGNNRTGLSSDPSTVQTALTTYKWSVVKTEENAVTTYFTDPCCYTPVNSSTADTTVVYKKGTTVNDTMTAYYKVDIVPYITGLGTRLDDAYASNTSVFNRSAKGTYPVRRGETGVKLYGFNLNGTSTTVKFNGTSVGTVTAKPSTDTTETRNYVTFTVPVAATSGAVSIEVNSIASLNNTNDDSKEYNQEANGINNNTLTDSRNVYVWGTNQVVTNNTVRYPTFRIGKDSNQSYVFSYDKGGTQTYLNKNGTEYCTGESYTQWYDTAVAIDAGGKLFGLALNGDCASPGSTSTAQCASFYFYPNVSSNLKVWVYTTNRLGTRIDFAESGAYAWENTSDGTTYRPNRIMNPKIVSIKNDNNKSNIYSVYYDAATSSIKFRYGEVNKTTPSVDSLKNFSNGSRGSAKDYYTISSGATVGTYAAVGATSNGTAVVCWKDGNSLMYKYNTTPSNSTTWSDAITIDSDYVGEYCDLAVDAAGGIHMAYFRAGGKLKYAYLSSYNDETADVCTVDSFLSVGTNISIETSSKTVTANGVTRYVPYISYFTDAIKMAKVAWPVTLGTNTTSNGTNTFTDGAVNDMFTGSWEVQVLPTNLTTTLLNYTIGVGEKKKDETNQSVMLGYGTKAGLETALLY